MGGDFCGDVGCRWVRGDGNRGCVAVWGFCVRSGEIGVGCGSDVCHGGEKCGKYRGGGDGSDIALLKIYAVPALAWFMYLIWISPF